MTRRRRIYPSAPFLFVSILTYQIKVSKAIDNGSDIGIIEVSKLTNVRTDTKGR